MKPWKEQQYEKAVKFWKEFEKPVISAQDSGTMFSDGARSTCGYNER